jgi:hypothetical protein
MNKEEFLKEILEACAFFHWEFYGTYKNYQIVAVTPSFIQISIIHFQAKEQWAEIVDFDNDEGLIDKMLDKL